MSATRKSVSFAAVLSSLLFATASNADDTTKPDKKDASTPVLLQTIGALAGTHLYQTYLNIGLIADAKAENSYDEKQAKELLASVLKMTELVDKQLDKVDKLELSKEDRQALEVLRKIQKKLKDQADELQAFWKTGDKEHGEKYEAIRKEAWQAIRTLLALTD
jgi:coenzyme F420-reducing hydrogenase alpha subunit